MFSQQYFIILTFDNSVQVSKACFAVLGYKYVLMFNVPNGSLGTLNIQLLTVHALIMLFFVIIVIVVICFASLLNILRLN